jgi:hypothetical protein
MSVCLSFSILLSLYVCLSFLLFKSVSECLSACLSCFYLSVYLSCFYLSTSICLSVVFCLPAVLFVFPPFRLFFLSLRLSHSLLICLWLLVGQSVCVVSLARELIFVYFSVCLSVSFCPCLCSLCFILILIVSRLSDSMGIFCHTHPLFFIRRQ